MTRLEILENRLEKLSELKDVYFTSQKIGGKLYANPRQAQYCNVLAKIKKQIRLENN